MKNKYDDLLTVIESRKIIAFGCGNFFKKFLLRYPELMGKIDFILDNKASIDSFLCEDRMIAVCRPEKLADVNLTEYVIVFFGHKWQEMKQQLDGMFDKEYMYFSYPFDVNYRTDKKLAYAHRIVAPVIEELDKFGTVNEILCEYGLESVNELREALLNERLFAIPRVPVVLTPKCSLRCKECSNLMWKFEDLRDLSAGKIIVSLEEMIKCFDFLPSVELIGGEPFAAGNLKEVLDYLVLQKKVLNIEITTNGTILPKQELIESLQNEKVIVRISDYSMVVNQDKFVVCMEENDIKFEKLIFDGWCETGGIEKRSRDSEVLIRQYYNCEAGYLCKTLWEDRLYPCARAASLAVLGIYENCPYVDMTNEENLQQRILQFWMAPTCGPCDYCNTGLDNQVLVKPAEQLTKRI